MENGCSVISRANKQNKRYSAAKSIKEQRKRTELIAAFPAIRAVAVPIIPGYNRANLRLSFCLRRIHAGQGIIQRNNADDDWIHNSEDGPSF